MAAAAAASPQQVAEAVRDAMLQADRVTRSLGMRVGSIAPGFCSVDMVVRDDMLNGFGTCHGGLITALADSAFAFACNSRNERSVAAALSVDFLAPARAGDTLLAVAQELGRNVYDVEIGNQRGERIAVFRGRAHRLRGQCVVALDDAAAATPR